MLFRRSKGVDNTEAEQDTAVEDTDVEDVKPEDTGVEDTGVEDTALEVAEHEDTDGDTGDIDVAVVEDESVEPDKDGVAVQPKRRSRFGRTRSILRAPLGALRLRGKVDERTLEELEEALILADVGMPTTQALINGVRDRLRSKELVGDTVALIDDLERSIIDLFGDEDRSLHRAQTGTTVWLFVGVNGVGKTTTIGKLASREIAAGQKVVLAAGDTFRAAAGEQLSLWAERSGADIVQGADGADPSSVVFDAIQHAHARDADLVMADSAGRLHNKTNLMEELKKIRRIADRDPGHVTEVLLVLDATTGQNGLAQAREFALAVGVTGIVLTKLDGTAKGGIVLAIRHELGLPIKLVGLGEGIDDLVEFDPAEFAAALFDEQAI